jgi:hypothetical protein
MNYKTGLFIYRLILSFLLIKNIIFYLPMADDLFGENGIVPYSIYEIETKGHFLKWAMFPFKYNFAPQIFLIFTLVCATFYLFAKWKFIFGVLLFYCIMMLKQRNGFILDGSDNVIQVTLPFLILAEAFPQKYGSNMFQTIQNNLNVDLFANALKIQVCFVYFFTSIAKMQGELWLNGTAIFYTMRVDEFNATPYNITLTENHYFVVISTYFTILFEICFPFLIWFKQTKYYIIFAGVLLHVGIWVFMRIDNFSWIMIGTYFIFINDEEYASLLNYLQNHHLLRYLKK